MTAGAQGTSNAAAAGLDQFVASFFEVWSADLFGFSTGQVVSAGIILLIAYAFRALISRIFIRTAARLASRTGTTFDDDLVKALEGPIKIIPVLLALFIVVELLGFEGEARATAMRLQTTLMAVMVFWALYRAVDPFEHVILPLRGAFSIEMIEWFTKALKIFFALVGAAVVLELWGVPVGPILAGLGIFGVAVALGAQDLFKNLIAGLSILIEKRFAIGDWIMVDGVVEGTVERINFRSTMVRRFDKGPVYVPNSKLSDNAVTNFSRMTHRRIYWKIGLTYSTTTEQLGYVRDKVFEYIMTNTDFAKPPEASSFVFVDGFNDSSIDLMIYCFTKTTNWGEWLAIKQDFAFAVRKIVDDAGTSFAFPSQSIYMEDMSEDAEIPEIVQAHHPRDWGVSRDGRGESEEG